MKNKSAGLPAASLPHEHEFKGYSMDELRYQRALLLVRREFVREKALKETRKIREQLPFVGSGHSSAQPSGLIGKVMKGLSFADYFILAVQALRIGRKLSSKFKKK